MTIIFVRFVRADYLLKLVRGYRTLLLLLQTGGLYPDKTYQFRQLTLDRILSFKPDLTPRSNSVAELPRKGE